MLQPPKSTSVAQSETASKSSLWGRPQWSLVDHMDFPHSLWALVRCLVQLGGSSLGLISATSLSIHRPTLRGGLHVHKETNTISISSAKPQFSPPDFLPSATDLPNALYSSQSLASSAAIRSLISSTHASIILVYAGSLSSESLRRTSLLWTTPIRPSRTTEKTR